MAIIHLYYFVFLLVFFYWVIKAGTENRHSPEPNFVTIVGSVRHGPARAFTDNLTGLGKRVLAKRLIYPHILHVTLKTDNCLFGHRRHSLEIILV